MDDSRQLAELFERFNPEFKPYFSRLLQFYELLVKENRVQNLTRLTSPMDAYYGHFLDCFELFKSELMGKGYTVDFGSGCGVPGIPMAILSGNNGALLESEVGKCQFLTEAISSLGLSGSVSVYHGRGEEFIRTRQVENVLVRAVASIERLFNIFHPCSTWNNLILFKGQKWQEEYEAVKLNKKLNKKFELTAKHEYHSNGVYRVILKFTSPKK
jgi:16S rRNA (guanine527-N7)-methyltransferase